MKRASANLQKSVEELELSVRTYNCLKNSNIRNVGELATKSEADLVRIKNCGRKSLNELKEILSGMGLSFGTKVDDKGRPVREEAESINLPRTAEYLLYFWLPKKDREAIPGDLEEEYNLIAQKFGCRKADVWYWKQVIFSIGPIVLARLKRIGFVTALAELFRRLST